MAPLRCRANAAVRVPVAPPLRLHIEVEETGDCSQNGGRLCCVELWLEEGSCLSKLERKFPAFLEPVNVFGKPSTA